MSTNPSVSNDEIITALQQPQTIHHVASLFKYSVRGMQNRLQRLERKGLIIRGTYLPDIRRTIYAAPSVGRGCRISGGVGSESLTTGDRT